MSNLDDRQSKALDFAADLIKQVITLSTGVLTLTLAFYDKFLNTSSAPTGWMVASWIVLALSIIAGIFALMALTGGLAADKQPSLNSLQQRLFAAAQFGLFVAGIAVMMAAVILSSKK